jgi:hypothetical protein
VLLDIAHGFHVEIMENNKIILYTELVALPLIILLGIFSFVKSVKELFKNTGEIKE